MSQALLIFKPDAAHRRAVRGGIWSWLSLRHDLHLTGLTWYQPPADLIEAHYDFLRERPFYPWLVDFMTALPLLVGRLQAESAVLEALRYDLGETRINEARPGSLRARFGIYGGINCMHVSDSAESGEREVAMWSEHVSLEGMVADPAQGVGGPDHTFELRWLATQLAAGVHAGLAALEMKRLLKEETELEGDTLQVLHRIILGAFA